MRAWDHTGSDWNGSVCQHTTLMDTNHNVIVMRAWDRTGSDWNGSVCQC